MTVALAAVLVTSACRQQVSPDAEADAAAADAIGASGAAAVVAATETAAAAANVPGLAERSTDDLEQAADRALREGRLYAPAGDSAIEYWLEARMRNPDSIAIASAVAGLQPYLLIGCEEAIARDDFAEAHRLHRLMAAADPAAPALPRLAAAIVEAEANAGREEAVRLAAEEARRQDRMRAAAATQARAEAVIAQSPPAGVPEPVPASASMPIQRSAPPPGAQSVVEAPGPAPTSAPSSSAALAAAGELPTPIDAPAGAAPAAAARAPTPRPVPEPATPRLLHQPPPRYPPLALGRRMEGAVEVAFTIRPDGQVENTRVVSATPPGVFDRSALAAVGDYRFEPTGRSVPSTVTVRFTLKQ